jgi:hypothetical protein
MTRQNDKMEFIVIVSSAIHVPAAENLHVDVLATLQHEKSATNLTFILCRKLGWPHEHEGLCREWKPSLASSDVTQWHNISVLRSSCYARKDRRLE